MEDRGDYLKRNGPAVPQASKQVHGEDSLGSRASQRRDHGYLKKLLQKVVRGGVNPVEDDRDVREKLGYYIKGTLCILLGLTLRSKG